RLIEQFPLAFDRKHFCSHFTQYSRLISGTGSDLQNFLTWLQIEQLSLKRDCIRLRNGLSGANRKGGIFIREMKKGLLHIYMSGHFHYRFKDSPVGDSFFLELIHQTAPHSLMSIRIFHWSCKIG